MRRDRKQHVDALLSVDWRTGEDVNHPIWCTGNRPVEAILRVQVRSAKDERCAWTAGKRKLRRSVGNAVGRRACGHSGCGEGHTWIR